MASAYELYPINSPERIKSKKDVDDIISRVYQEGYSRGRLDEDMFRRKYPDGGQH
jgi:hypothetical protein